MGSHPWLCMVLRAWANRDSWRAWWLSGYVVSRLRRWHTWMPQSFVAACLEAAAVAGGVGWSALRGRFRSVDLFVLEDIEGLERGPLARDELAHTLDALDATVPPWRSRHGRRPGHGLSRTWPRRLVNRLMGGLATRIAPPGLASRRRYILQHASQHGVALQAEAVETLAEAADGYRTLDGWISRLALEARLKHEQDEPAEQAQVTATRWTTLTCPPTSRPVPLDSCTQSPQSWPTKPTWSSHS